MYLLYKNIFSWENISRELIFANWVSEIANFTEGILWIPIRNLILLKVFSRFKTQKVNLAIILMSIKQNFLPQLNFPEETFSRIGQSYKNMFLWKFLIQKYLITFIIYTIGTYEILRHQCLEREKEREKRFLQLFRLIFSSLFST